MDALDIRKARLSSAVKWGLGIAAAVLISPVIFLAVQGLIGLALAGIVGLAIINFAPVLGMKFANWKLKAIKADPASEFERIRTASQQLQSVAPEAKCISAGMSQDFELAIAHGATHLRIGTAITGKRAY